MRKIIVDTNAFLRFLLNDIPAQKITVEKLFIQAKEKNLKIIVPQIVLFEIEFVCRKYYNFSKEEIVDKLKSLVSVSYFKIQNKEIFKRAIQLFNTENLSLVDCFLLSYAKQKEAEIFTFDKTLKTLVDN